MSERTKWVKRIRELKEQKAAQKRIINQLRKENGTMKDYLFDKFGKHPNRKD